MLTTAPQDVDVDPEVFVDQDVPEPGDLLPLDLGTASPEICREALSVDRMKRRASRLTWWHTLPHKSYSRSTPQGGEASHGPYWHRRPQEGQSDLCPRRGGRADRAADPHRARVLRGRARRAAPGADRDR